MSSENVADHHLMSCAEVDKMIRTLQELRDGDLFRQPIPSECPICCLPLSLDTTKSCIMACCSKMICNGCDYANWNREDEGGLKHRCAFCREPVPETKQEAEKNRMERINANDPIALSQLGRERYDKRDYEGAFEYLTKAAELGDTDAHYYLSMMYWKGLGVEKDWKKSIFHSEEAAIAGHATARHNLGCIQRHNGRFERARKHFIIDANLGYNDSLKMLRQLYADGHASKEDYAAALRACQAAVDETKSAEREKAEKAAERGEW